jgi:hypothetical protein
MSAGEAKEILRIQLQLARTLHSIALRLSPEKVKRVRLTPKTL